MLPRVEELRRGTRVHSDDYGDGTIVAMLSIGVQIEWDKVLAGTLNQRRLVHDRSYVERLKRL